MSETGIPDRVRRFLGKYIHSVEQLEILMLLNSEPGRAWSPQEVNQIIRSNECSIAERLRDLVASNLLQRITSNGETFQLHPELHDAPVIAEIGELYKSCRLAIIETIYAAPSATV